MDGSFLPVLFPGEGVRGGIPGWDAAYEQRSQYPYTYTSVLNPALEGHKHAYAHGTGRGAAQGTVGSIRLSGAARSEQNSSGAATGAKAEGEAAALLPTTLAGHIICEMDPLASLYSKEWMHEVEQEFRDRIRSFLSEEAVSAVLGKTRCRDCLYYFEKSAVKPSSSRMASLGNFLSFWWGTPVRFGDKVYGWKMTKEQKSAPAWTLSHLDNGTWVVKK
jgi:hypothetical protein